MEKKVHVMHSKHTIPFLFCLRLRNEHFATTWRKRFTTGKQVQHLIIILSLRTLLSLLESLRKFNSNDLCGPASEQLFSAQSKPSIMPESQNAHSVQAKQMQYSVLYVHSQFFLR